MVLDFKKKKKKENMLEALNWELNLGAFRNLETLCQGANLLLSILLLEIYFKIFNFFFLTKGSKCIPMYK